MGIFEKMSYLLAISERYAKAARAKADNINEFGSVCNYNRKYAIRLLNKKPGIKKLKTGPKSVYQDDGHFSTFKTNLVCR